MKKTVVIFTLFVVGLFVQTASAQSENLIDKETFIKATHFLEQDPFNKDAKKYSEIMLYYLIQTKDVSAIICSDLTKAALNKKNKFSSELFGQYTFGLAAFKLENPDRATDENAAQFAGLESMLKACEAMVKVNPKAKFAGVEDLIAKRDNGTLAKLVADTDCGKK